MFGAKTCDWVGLERIILDCDKQMKGNNILGRNIIKPLL